MTRLDQGNPESDSNILHQSKLTLPTRLTLLLQLYITRNGPIFESPDLFLCLIIVCLYFILLLFFPHRTGTGQNPCKNHLTYPEDDNTVDSPKHAHTPLVQHFKESNKPDAKRFAVGDTKFLNSATYYFFDCLNHCKRINRSVYKPEHFHNNSKWLKNQTPVPGTEKNQKGFTISGFTLPII